MNCMHVQELLPLYVGRDLEEKPAQLVAAHLQSCVECASSADEYRETRQLLQQFAPPPFNEALYSGIRQRVLREIGRESPKSVAPTLPQLVASLFRPRIRWAVASALLLAVSVFAFYFIAKRANDGRDGQRLAGKGAKVDKPISPSIKESNETPPAATGQNTGADKTIAGSVDSTHQSQRRKRPGAAADRIRSVAVNTSGTRSMTSEASPESNNLAEPDAVPARDPATSEKTLRVEMQTKDQNIRIIWFSHQPPKQDSPGKFSKGI